MFKQTVLAGLVTASVFSSAYVLAEDADTTPAPAAPQMELNMNQEMNRLQHMIQVGSQNGELTDSEIAQLTQTQERLRLTERDMLKDGLNAAETKQLRTMLREHEFNIMGQRNNAERKQYQHQYENQNGNGEGGQGNLQQQQQQQQQQQRQAAPANNGNGNLFQGQGSNAQGQGNATQKKSTGSNSGLFNFGGSSSSGRGGSGGGAGRSGR